jgi:hypothetical protein
MGLTAVPIPGTACSDRSVALLVELLAERLVESLTASIACSESILVLTGITAAIGAKENGAGRAYRTGPSRVWLKVENPDTPAMVRHREGLVNLGLVLYGTGHF